MKVTEMRTEISQSTSTSEAVILVNLKYDTEMLTNYQ